MPPGITDGVKVLLAGLWHMAAVLITAPFWIAGLLLVALVGWLERVGALPAIGFLIGVILCPGAPLWRSVAHRLGRIGSVIGASGFEFFTLRGRANKVWAAAPVVLAAILAIVVWPTFFHTFTRNVHAPRIAIEKSASTH